MKSYYFDGINSKPLAVVVQIVGDDIEISMVGNENSNLSVWSRYEISINSFSSDDHVILRNDISSEQLELVGDGVKEFVKFIVIKKSIDQRMLQFISTVGPIRLVFGSALVIISIIYGYMSYVAPYIGDKIVNIIPIDIERKAGEVVYRNMDLLIDRDSVKSVLLMDFYNSCGFKSQYDITFEYSQNDIVNAFALPGGRIVIFEGLINRTKCWDELAALMAHELAHVNERHSLKHISKSLTSYLIISILTGDIAGLSSVILENAHNIYALSNSRKHEKEADLIGLNYLYNGLIRPESMLDLLTRLEESIDSTSDFMGNFGYLNTHPLNSARIKYIESEIENNLTNSFEIKDNPKAEKIWGLLQRNAY